MTLSLRQPLHYYEPSDEVAMESLFNFCALFTATRIIKCVLVCKVIWLNKHTRWLWRYMVSVWNKIFLQKSKHSFFSKYFIKILISNCGIREWINKIQLLHISIRQFNEVVLIRYFEHTCMDIFIFINYIGLCFV